jgi:predicted amidophosphoribosyltransferase
MVANSSEFFMVCWLLAAAIGAAIGATKGRAFAGAIWGLLLGPLGWIVMAAAPDQRPKCQECGGDTISGANRCKNCGHKLHLSVNAEAQTPHELEMTDGESAMTLPECPGCFSRMANGVCSMCGFAESPNTAFSDEQAQKIEEIEMAHGNSF